MQNPPQIQQSSRLEEPDPNKVGEHVAKIMREVPASTLGPFRELPPVGSLGPGKGITELHDYFTSQRESLSNAFTSFFEVGKMCSDTVTGLGAIMLVTNLVKHIALTGPGDEALKNTALDALQKLQTAMFNFASSVPVDKRPDYEWSVAVITAVALGLLDPRQR